MVVQAAALLPYAPLALEIIMELYDNRRQIGDAWKYISDEVGEVYRSLMDTTYRALPQDQRERIQQDRGYRLLKLARNGATLGISSFTYLYKRLITALEVKGEYERQSTPKMEEKMAIASLIFLASLSLSYFALVPQKTTVHAIVPMTTNVVGLVLSFIILCLGAWLVLGKDRVT